MHVHRHHDLYLYLARISRSLSADVSVCMYVRARVCACDSYSTALRRQLDGPPDPVVEHITRNILARFAQQCPPLDYYRPPPPPSAAAAGAAKL